MPPASTRCRSTSSRRRCRTCATSSTSCRRTPRRTGAPSPPAWPSCRPRSGLPGVAARRPRQGPGLPAPPGRRRAPSSARDLTADDGYFAKIVADATVGDEPLAGELATPLAAAAQAAAAAYGDIADWLERELLPHAPEEDACGRERYPLESRYFLGATVDLEETYRWGQQEVRPPARPDAPRSPSGLEPGATVERGVEILDADERIPAARHATPSRPGCRSRPTRSIADLGRRALRHPRSRCAPSSA